MSAEDNQFSISMSYDTCGEDEADAVRTMLAAIEARSSVFITIHKDGVDEPIFEDEICAMESQLNQPAEPSRLEQTAKEFVYRITEAEAEALILNEWRALDAKLCGLGAYDTDQYDQTIIFALHRDQWHLEQQVADTIQEELDRMTGATTTRALEALDGYGSF